MRKPAQAMFDPSSDMVCAAMMVPENSSTVECVTTRAHNSTSIPYPKAPSAEKANSDNRPIPATAPSSTVVLRAFPMK